MTAKIPTDEFVARMMRMMAFAALMAALEDGDRSAERDARRELRDLGLEVRVKGVLRD